jgi:hypothetical protein
MVALQLRSSSADRPWHLFSPDQTVGRCIVTVSGDRESDTPLGHGLAWASGDAWCCGPIRSNKWPMRFGSTKKHKSRLSNALEL